MAEPAAPMPSTPPSSSTLRARIRDDGLVRNEALYVTLALDVDGEKHVLGLWIEQSEGPKFWLKVMNELRTRGVGDILIAIADGLKGFPEAIAASFRDDGSDLHRPSDPQLARLHPEGPVDVDANNPSHPYLLPAKVTGAAGDTTTADRGASGRG